MSQTSSNDCALFKTKNLVRRASGIWSRVAKWLPSCSTPIGRSRPILATEDAADFIRSKAAHRRISVQILAGHGLDKIGTFERGNELIAIAIEPKEPAFRAPVGAEFMLGLDGIRDPRNFGKPRAHRRLVRRQTPTNQQRFDGIYNPRCLFTMGSALRIRGSILRESEHRARELRGGRSANYIADMGSTRSSRPSSRVRRCWSWGVNRTGIPSRAIDEGKRDFDPAIGRR